MPNRATRRSFLKLSAAAASVTTAKLTHATPAAVSIQVITDQDGAPIRWAQAKLEDALTASGVRQSNSATLKLVIAEAQSPLAKPFPRRVEVTQPETVALIPGAQSLLITGTDTRGLVYGLLELADRIRSSDSPATALHLAAPVIETTPNKVRSVARAFVSEIEDKAWFYDRAFWTSYLDTLVAARFNRFNFTLGIGYDFPRGVTGDYLHFPYPYLVNLPNYPGVHVEPPLQPGERQRNLETLQFVAAETARRGLDFQLGIWTHAYQWTDSPHSDHTIAGLTPETHAPYCRDALAALLAACPQITGLTLRIHGESGIPEGSYPFWQTLFDAIPAARTPDGKPRVIEIDMHAKGLNQIMIDMARKTGMPVKAGAKFWAEHLGLGYQQSDIRAAEIPKPGHVDSGTFSLSGGSRSFTRYGYGDFYQYPQGRPAGTNAESIDLLYRVWPGTQKHLLWGDPALAAGYGRAANFCGAAGLELMEPLTFKGREGSGHPGGRNVYTDAALGAPRLASETWEGQPPNSPGLHDLDSAKFTVTYMLWGRYLYNPDTAPDFHHRYLKQTFGTAGPALEVALAASSRILPLVTTAWCPSASNHEFWPEMLTPVNILPYTTRPLYPDSPAPHNVSAISPLDPQLFTTIGQHAENLISGKADARYNTSEVIAWLEAMVATSTKALAAAHTANPKHITDAFRRAEEDILILNGLGTYYANLFRAGLYYSVLVNSKDANVAAYGGSHRKARDAWENLSKRAASIYKPDLSYGTTPFRRGHWVDRLATIDKDIASFEGFLILNYQEVLGTLSGHSTTGFAVADSKKSIFRTVNRAVFAIDHTVPESFHPGSDLTLAITAPPAITSAILLYRHVTQAERWLSTPMQQSGDMHTAVIPAAYTASPYPLQYYFELHTATAATLHPAFNPTLSNQPYFAIHKRT